MVAAPFDSRRHPPAPRTTLIGRQREIGEVCGLVRRPEVRLLVLSGPGGTGKTRLALAVAEQLRDDFDDAITFVSLAPITDPALVASAISQAFGIRESAERSLRDGLVAVLASRRLLLVLDNFEHVLPAAPLIDDLLTTCPQLTVLVTSRAVLHLSGERDYLVPPLSLPDPQQLPPIEHLGAVEAIRLFVERAQAAKADFTLTADRAATVAAICRQLDGLPLAIELAAARISLLSPQALLARLEHRLHVLTSGPRDVPARQQTLRATMAWSYDLLPAEVQRLFRQLAVFAGGLTMEAAEAVCEIDTSVFDGLAALVDHSLVGQVEQPDGSTRFGMLETIREFGLEQLDASVETDLARRRHLAYFLELAERSKREIHSARQKAWLDRLEAEHNNLRSALQYALDHDPVAALRLGGALGWFWFMRGHLIEGTQWLRSALTRSDDHAVAAHAKALTAAGMLLRELNDNDAARRHLDEAIGAYRALGDTAGLVEALLDLAGVWVYSGEFARARPLLEEGLRLARAIGDRYGELTHLSTLALVDGDLSLTHQCLALARELVDTRGIAMLLGHIGFATVLAGDYDRAAGALREGLDLARELEDGMTILFLLRMLGFLALEQGNPVLARDSFVELLDLVERTLGGGGDIDTLEGLAGVALLSGMPERAARLLGAAEALREQRNEPISHTGRPQQERAVARVRAKLREAELRRAWSAGRAMSEDEALALALAPLSAPVRAPRTRFPKGLTPREVDVLRLVAQGLTDAEVAERLLVARRTINAHLTSIYTKLGVSSRAGATRFAVEHDLTQDVSRLDN